MQKANFCLCILNKLQQTNIKLRYIINTQFIRIKILLICKLVGFGGTEACGDVAAPGPEYTDTRFTGTKFRKDRLIASSF